VFFDYYLVAYAPLVRREGIDLPDLSVLKDAVELVKGLPVALEGALRGLGFGFWFVPLY